MKRVLLSCVMLVGVLAGSATAKCVNGQSYQLKGYMETDAGIPVTGKTLSQVIFDIKYDDGTDSLGNTATAEMINGWYRRSYTSNGKSGVYTMRDSTSTYKNFPGAPLEGVCDAQDPLAMVQAVWSEMQSTYTTAGTFGDMLDSQVSAAGGDPWATALPGAYGAGTAGKIVGDALAAHTPQSGDSFARLGAPAGASVSADIATVKSDTAAVLVDTGTSGVVVADKTGYSLSAAGIDVIWDEAQAGHTTAGTFGRHLDAQISTSGSGATAVTAGTGNSSAWRIPIDETTVITANGQYIGAKLTCSKETREVVDTVQGTPDLIIVEPGNLFTSAPASVSCDLDWR